MIRTVPCVLAVAFAAAFVGAPQQAPQFHVDARMVTVYATVTDASGRVITDLGQSDFDVFDNGVRRDVAVFTNDIQPITIAVMLDRSASMEVNFDLVRAAAEQFVSHLLPADKARIGSFSLGVRLDPEEFTSSHADLLDVLHTRMQAPGPTPLWNAANTAIGALGNQTGRRVVLLFTDGKDRPDTPGVTIDEVRTRASTEGVMMYAIGLASGCSLPATTVAAAPRGTQVSFQRPIGRPPGIPPIFRPGKPGIPGGPGMPDPPRRRLPQGEADEGDPCVGTKPDPDLKMLASESGGGYFELHGTDDLGGTFSRVAFELHHQFLLAFAPAALDGSVHQVEVKTKDPALTVRARKTYVATPEK